MQSPVCAQKTCTHHLARQHPRLYRLPTASLTASPPISPRERRRARQYTRYHYWSISMDLKLKTHWDPFTSWIPIAEPIHTTGYLI